jgi:O-antigen ligase
VVNEGSLFSRWAGIFDTALLFVALALIEILIGGTRLIYSLPTYAILAVVALLTVFWFAQPRPRPAQTCLISSAIFFGYVLGRAFLSPAPYVARPDIYSIAGALVVYWFIALVCTNAKPRAWVMIGLLTLALAHVLIGAVQFRDGNNFMPISFLQRFDYGRRASGFYICPNHLAGALEVIGIFGISLVCWSRFPKWSKLLIGYAAAVCYFGVLLTGSRGGYASATVSLLVFATLSLVTLRRAGARLFFSIGAAGVVAAILAGALAFLVVKNNDYLANRTQNALDTAPIRLDLWHAALEEWKAAPLLGTGAGTYLYYGRMFRTPRMQQDPIYAHNDYLHLLGEYGAVAGVLLVLFLGTHLYHGWKNFLRLGPKRVAVSSDLLSTSLALNLGAISSVAAYLVHSVVDFNLHIPANALLLAFVFGILANAGVARGGEDAGAPISIRLWRAALIVTGAFLAIQSFRLLPAEYFAEHARTAQRNNHSDEAIGYASRGLERDKQNPFLYQYLASAKLTRCDSLPDLTDRRSCYTDAVGALQKAHDLAPFDRTFQVPLALTYDALERFAEAEWIFDEARQWDPKSVYLNEIYNFHLNRWRNPEMAREDAQANEAESK